MNKKNIKPIMILILSTVLFGIISYCLMISVIKFVNKQYMESMLLITSSLLVFFVVNMLIHLKDRKILLKNVGEING